MSVNDLEAMIHDVILIYDMCCYPVEFGTVQQLLAGDRIANVRLLAVVQSVSIAIFRHSGFQNCDVRDSGLKTSSLSLRLSL